MGFSRVECCKRLRVSYTLVWADDAVSAFGEPHIPKKLVHVYLMSQREAAQVVRHGSLE